jgi:hypothetical protein
VIKLLFVDELIACFFSTDFSFFCPPLTGYRVSFQTRRALFRCALLLDGNHPLSTVFRIALSVKLCKETLILTKLFVFGLVFCRAFICFQSSFSMKFICNFAHRMFFERDHRDVDSFSARLDTIVY